MNPPLSEDERTKLSTRRSPDDERLVVPDHELIRRVGKGSYGEVWLARSVIGTFRAVKIVYRKSFSSGRPYEREFKGIQKFEPVSRTHPGLISLLHIGRQPAYFFYVMEIADDVATGQQIQPDRYIPKSLGELLRRQRPPFAECLRIAMALSDALNHMHRQRLIHRDIKPSNIIFVQGAPKFADIGLVTDIGESATFVGTEGYMPPEGPGSPSADLYSFGKVLYELFVGGDPSQFPSLPTDFLERSDGAAVMRVNTIILQACDPDPRERFETAAQLRDALAEIRASSCPEAVGNGVSGAGQSPKIKRIALLVGTSSDFESRLARTLKEGLISKGFDVFSAEAVNLGVEWARQTENQIRSADAIVSLLTPGSLQDAVMAYAVEIVRQTIRQSVSKPISVALRIGVTGPLPPHFEVALQSSSELAWVGQHADEGLQTDLIRLLG